MLNKWTKITIILFTIVVTIGLLLLPVWVSIGDTVLLNEPNFTQASSDLIKYDQDRLVFGLSFIGTAVGILWLVVDSVVIYYWFIKDRRSKHEKI